MRLNPGIFHQQGLFTPVLIITEGSCADTDIFFQNTNWGKRGSMHEDYYYKYKICYYLIENYHVGFNNKYKHCLSFVLYTFVLTNIDHNQWDPF